MDFVCNKWVSGRNHAQEKQRMRGGLCTPVLALALLIGFGEGPLQAEKQETRRLSLNEVVALALAQNHDIAVQNLDRVIEAERMNMARAVFDPRLEGSYAYQHIDKPQNAQDLIATGGGATALTNPRIFQERNDVAKLALVKKFHTGTSVEFASSLSVLENSLNRERPPSLFSPEYETYTGVTMTQPLLRDFGPKVNLAGIRIAKSNNRIADLEWRSTTAATVAGAMKLYYDVVFTHANMEIQRDAISLAEKLLEDNRKRSEKGVIPPNEVLVAEGAVYGRKEQALVAETQYVERQAALQLLFKRGADVNQAVRIVPTGSLDDSVEVPERSKLLDRAQNSRYDILQALEVVGQREIQTEFARNQVLPRFDLIASAGFHGLDGSTGGSFDEAFNSQAPEWTVGVSFSVPLGLKRARAQARLAKHEETQAKIDVDRARAQIGLELDTVLDRINTDRQRLVAARKAGEVASQTLKNEIKRLDQGVTTSYQVLEYQKEYSQTRSRELAALADLNKDQLDLWLVTGQLLERQGIEVIENNDQSVQLSTDGGVEKADASNGGSESNAAP